MQTVETLVSVASPAKEKNNVFKQHPVICLFVIAYAISWSIWGCEIFWGIKIPGFFALAGSSISALIVAFLSGGPSGLKQLGSRMIRWKVGVQWYLLAIFIIPAVCMITLGINGLVNINEMPKIENLALAIPMLLSNILLHFFSEEVGWRGFALPRLKTRYNPLVASLILGFFWGCWHIPYWFIPGSFQTSLPFVGFLALIMAQTVLMTWVSKDSAFLGVVFHAAANTSFALFGVLNNGHPLFWLVVAVQWAITLIVIGLGGLKTEKLTER
ncbi:MAG TPA: type II CAAX endopeptidase family protein [Chloroflexia bacterium]|nr:type II CAAX endopeptidase family protein [Chloroflexia bacterium]